MSKWIVALLVGLLSIKWVIGAEAASFMEDFRDDMGLEIGSYESDQISLESEDVSRRDFDGDEESILATFSIPNESMSPVAESMLPTRKKPISEQSALISQPVLSDPLVPQPSAVPLVQSASLPLKPTTAVLETVHSMVGPIPLLDEPVPVGVFEQPIDITIIPSAKPHQPTRVPQSARANPSSNVVLSMEVSKAFEDASSLQQQMATVAHDDEEEDSGYYEEAISSQYSSEGEVTDGDDSSFEEITYSRPRSSFSEDSQSDSSDAEWYALIHSRRPKDNNQPPPVTNIPSSRQTRRHANLDGNRRERRGNHRGNRKLEGKRTRDDYRLREDYRERLARYDPTEPRQGSYFVAGNDLKQREAYSVRMRGQHLSRGSSSNSNDSYSSSDSGEEDRRYRRLSHKSRRLGRRRPGYFERLVRKIPRTVNDL